MKKIPFYANADDNMHCAVACYRMLFEHFLDKKFDGWEEIDKMAGHKEHRAAWTVTIWERMSRQGFDVRMIENFDYKRYKNEGDRYLRAYMTPEELEWQIEHTNIQEIAPLIPSFLKEVHLENRRPTLEDIDEMLDDDRLVFLTLNSKALNGQQGYASHAVLVIGKEGDEYIVHDPGNPPQPNRHIAREKIWQAMGADNSNSEATGVKFKIVPTRVDVILARMHPEYSRAALAKLFDKGDVTYKDKVLKSGDKLMADVDLDADLSSLTPSLNDIDIPVLYEDDDCIVLNKPAGVLTHLHGIFSPEATVASFLRHKMKDLEGVRAGIVHRLDRATSGVIICAKHAKAMHMLQKQFADREVQKTYIAIVEGHPKEPEAIIDMPIERNPKAPATFRIGSNGKQATTRYKVLKQTDKYSLVELLPKTGRTHQLRVHMAYIGNPIIGDPLYGHGSHGDRLYLHAKQLEITIPEGEHKTFSAPVPSEFEELMNA
jgi:23S rRNA pseudouridine1911/1915/1917 synthase